MKPGWIQKTAGFIAGSLALAAFPAESAAQSNFEFSGYAVNLPAVQRSGEFFAFLFSTKQWLVTDLTRVRFREKLDLWDGARINAEHETNLFYQNGTTRFSGGSGQTNRQLYDLSWKMVDETHWTAKHLIDRLYLRQEFSNGNITFGRQRISWGTGRIWNPTDLFNPINPANFSKIEKDGADAVALKLIFGSFTDLEAVYNAHSVENQNGAARFRTNWKAYDLAAVTGYFDERVILGGDFAGNLGEAGFRGEGLYSAPDGDLLSGFLRFILGLDHQFSPEWYGLVEYQFNGEGTTNPLRYDLDRLSKGEITNLNKNYLFAQASYLVHPLVTLSAGLNANLNDHSGFFTGSVLYSATENFYVTAGAQISRADRFDEYWYYGSSGYLQAEYYF